MEARGFDQNQSFTVHSLRQGDVGDRWTTDVSGGLPVTKNGNRYAVAFVEYVNTYVVLVPVKIHTAEILASVLITEVAF